MDNTWNLLRMINRPLKSSKTKTRQIGNIEHETKIVKVKTARVKKIHRLKMTLLLTAMIIPI